MRRLLTRFSIVCLFACFCVLSSCSKKGTTPPPTPTIYDPQGIYGTTTTFAGNVDATSLTNGTGPGATFFLPTGIVCDASGNIYVADAGNNMIRKITPAGVVSTLAGTPTKGFKDGTGLGAAFEYPAAVAVDANGNVYVADQGNNLIRKVTSAGVVTTLAGTRAAGAANGAGASATFYDVIGVAVDASGNVYVSDQGNNLIRKITPGGIVSTFAGSGATGSADGTGTAASFNTPAGITIDASGNLYVADEFNQKIRKITPAGVVTTVAGSGAVGNTNGPAAAATFNYPAGVAIDANGIIYVADHSNNIIRAISSTGNVTTFAGTGTFGYQNGLFIASTFGSPTGVAVDPTTGNVFVADNANNLIRKLTTKQ
jgi:sugar lactone lactonase YvrE